MFHHIKELQFDARVSGPDPRFATLLLEQFGGANGELKAAMQYFVFCADYEAPETMEALRQDLRDAAYAGIGRFPTLILHHHTGRSIVLVGYRPYSMLCAALEHLAPDLPRRPEMPSEDLALAYITHWGSLTVREVAEVLDKDTMQTEKLLEALVIKRKLTRMEVMPCATPLYASLWDKPSTSVLVAPE